MPLPIVSSVLRRIAPKILPDKVERAIFGGPAGAIAGGVAAGAAGGVIADAIANAGDGDMDGGGCFKVWVNAEGEVVKTSPCRRRRRRRLLTSSDKQDIAALRGILGDSQAFKSAVGGLLSKRL